MQSEFLYDQYQFSRTDGKVEVLAGDRELQLSAVFKKLYIEGAEYQGATLIASVQSNSLL